MRKWISLFLALLLLTVAGLTSAQDSTATPAPEITETPAPLILDPLLGFGTTPPLEITLPEGWQLALRDTFTYQDIIPDADGQLETLPIDVYYGPVTGGEGWIVMLWGYDSIVSSEGELTLSEYYERAAWLNGLRMLQFVVFDSNCNIGTAPQRDYTIGGLPAIGTTFSAVDCPFDLPDTRGWFAAMNIDNLNFAFFAYADPIQPAGSIVEFELQAIIDTVVFNVEDITITAQEFEATSQAVLATQQSLITLPTLTPSSP